MIANGCVFLIVLTECSFAGQRDGGGNPCRRVLITKRVRTIVRTLVNLPQDPRGLGTEIKGRYLN